MLCVCVSAAKATARAEARRAIEAARTHRDEEFARAREEWDADRVEYERRLQVLHDKYASEIRKQRVKAQQGHAGATMDSPMWAAAAGAAGGEGGDLAAQLDAAIVERISLLNDNRRLTNEVTELTLSLETARAQLNDVRVTNAQLQRAVQRVAAATVKTAQASPSSAAAGAEDGISQVLTETATAKASADRQVRHFVRECQRLRRVLASKQRQLVQLRSQQAPQGADGVEDDGVTAGGVPTAVAGGEAGTSAALVVDDLGEFSDGEVDKEDGGDGGDGSGSGAANGSKRTTPRFDPMPASTAQALTQLRRRLARRTLQVRRLQQHLAEVVAPQLQEYKQAAAAAAAAGTKVEQQGDNGVGAAGPGAGAGAGADSSSAPSQDEAVDAPSSADAFIQRMLAAEKRADVAARQLTQARLEARDNEDRARQFEDTCTKLQHQLAEAEAKLQGGSGSGSSSSSQSQADVNEVKLLQQQVAELEARLQAESKRLRSQHTVRFVAAQCPAEPGLTNNVWPLQDLVATRRALEDTQRQLAAAQRAHTRTEPAGVGGQQQQQHRAVDGPTPEQLQAERQRVTQLQQQVDAAGDAAAASRVALEQRTRETQRLNSRVDALRSVLASIHAVVHSRDTDPAPDHIDQRQGEKG